MKDTEMKDLLDRLKSEVRQPASNQAARAPEPVTRGPEQQKPDLAVETKNIYLPPRPQTFVRPDAPRAQRVFSPDGSNIIWSENKEAILFGILASVLVIFGGMTASLRYLIVIGAVAFSLFSAVMFLTLLGYCLNFRKNNSEEGQLGLRIDQLARRLEALAAKGGAAQFQGTGGHNPDKELEKKVEELRTLVKSLSKAVESHRGI